MIRRIAQVLSGVTALALALAILVGVPAALIRFVGWPLPTALPSLEELRQFTQVGVSDETIVKALALIVWTAWVQVAYAIVAEATALLRGRTAFRLRVLPGLQPLAAKLVATVALIAAASASSRTPAMAASLHSIVATAPAVAPVESQLIEVGQPPTSSTAGTTTTVVTTARDSWWQLADAHLGDGMRWREIRDLNLGREVAPSVIVSAETNQLDAGWQILVPSSEEHEVDEAAQPATALDQMWQVESGDHFWRIAEETLSAEWGRAPTDEEITPYWRELVEVNRDRLAPPEDPDLIYPGQEFEIPAAPPAPDEQRATVDATEEAEPSSGDMGEDTGSAVDAPAASESQSPAVVDEEVEAQVDVEHLADGWRSAIERGNAESAPQATEEVEAADEGPATDEDEVRNGLGVPAGLAAGAAAASLLAAGVTALIRWRRRAAMRQRPERYRLPTPLRYTEDMVNRLEAAAMPEQTLDDLASLLSSIPAGTNPALVTTVDDGTVTLLFDDQADLPEPPVPWTLADDGSDGPVGWTAKIGDRGPDRSIGLPLLVTLGRTGATNVLANVAALPTICVEGAEKDVRAVLRNMTIEVATSRLAVPVEVVVVHDYLMETIENTRQTRDPDAEIAAALGEIEADVVPDDRTPRLLVCHPDVPAPEVPPELVGTVGVMHTATEEPSRWTLQIADRTSGRLVLPDGGTVELTLPDVDAWEVDRELRRLDRGAAPPDEPVPAVEAAIELLDDNPPVAAEPSSNGQVPPVEAASPTEPAFCEVRILGPVEVWRDGERVDGIQPRSLELLVYLATHRQPAGRERLDDVIWGGFTDRPTSQRVTSALTRLRKELGDGPDGKPLIPRRAGAGRIALSDNIGCDLDRALAHLALARDLPAQAGVAEIEAALDLVRGEPLQELPVGWGSEVVQRAIAELQDAAMELARLRRERGDLDAAEDALRRGLRLLDPADPFYVELAAIERERGHPERVRMLWEELLRRHAADADEIGGYASHPPPEIELAFQELITTAG